MVMTPEQLETYSTERQRLYDEELEKLTNKLVEYNRVEVFPPFDQIRRNAEGDEIRVSIADLRRLKPEQLARVDHAEEQG